MKNHLAPLGFFALLFLFACGGNPRKIMESGDYEAAIERSIDKLRGDRKKDPETVQTLELAFQKATAEDLRRINGLKSAGRADNWADVVRLYQKIERRQNRLNPLLPLVDKDGYQANFRFVDTAQPLNEARDRAAEFYYERGGKLLTEARLDQDPDKARAAYEALERIRDYRENYRNVRQLQREAHQLGTVHLVFRFRNGSQSIVPSNFERELLRTGSADLNSFWREFHTTRARGVDYDYEVVMNLTDIEVTPEREQQRAYIDTKEIEDGFDYVLDENGNVQKDTSGNDIKVTRYTNISAEVLEVFQSKYARLRGRLEYFDLRTDNLLVSEPVQVEAIFENYASTFSGDKRALSAESRRRIGNQPVPFPTDEELLLDAANLLKPIIKEKVRSSTFGR